MSEADKIWAAAKAEADKVLKGALELRHAKLSEDLAAIEAKLKELGAEVKDDVKKAVEKTEEIAKEIADDVKEVVKPKAAKTPQKAKQSGTEGDPED